MPNVFVPREELVHLLNYAAAQEAPNNVASFTATAENPTPPHHTEMLIHAIPGQCDAANALILKDVMSKALGFKKEAEASNPIPAVAVQDVTMFGSLKDVAHTSRHA